MKLKKIGVFFEREALILYTANELYLAEKQMRRPTTRSNSKI